MTAFWDIAPCRLVKIDGRFRDAYCLHHHGIITSEIPVCFETTLCYIPEGCLSSRRRESLKYHSYLVFTYSRAVIPTEDSSSTAASKRTWIRPGNDDSLALHAGRATADAEREESVQAKRCDQDEEEGANHHTALQQPRHDTAATTQQTLCIVMCKSLYSEMKRPDL
jgi:hypothetical protein